MAIARSPASVVQAVGRDAAGRWQYLYRVSHAARRSRGKFDRLVQFGEALPALRRALTRDLGQRGLPKDRVLACAVAVMAACFARAGSEEYAAEDGGFGLATLRNRHVTVAGDRIRLDYRGKRRLRQRHELTDRRLARIVAAMLRLPGVEVFKYRDGRGRIADVSRRQVNRYIKRVMGRRFSARDFRTWAGTLICAGALARGRGVTGAVREAATYLGNTEKVCRSSYVHPAMLRAFDRGKVVTHALARPVMLTERRGASLVRSERALLALLKQRGGRR